MRGLWKGQFPGTAIAGLTLGLRWGRITSMAYADPLKLGKVELQERQWWDKQLRDDASLPISFVVRKFGEQVRFPLV